jgi:hypothetical protein
VFFLLLIVAVVPSYFNNNQQRLRATAFWLQRLGGVAGWLRNKPHLNSIFFDLRLKQRRSIYYCPKVTTSPLYLIVGAVLIALKI